MPAPPRPPPPCREAPEAPRARPSPQAGLKLPDDPPVQASVLRVPGSPPALRRPEALLQPKAPRDCFLVVDKWLFRVFWFVFKIQILSWLKVD